MIESFPEWRGTRSGIFLFSCCASRSCFRSEVVLMRKNRPTDAQNRSSSQEIRSRSSQIAHACSEFAPVARKSLMLVPNSLPFIANSLTLAKSRSCALQIRSPPSKILEIRCPFVYSFVKNGTILLQYSFIKEYWMYWEVVLHIVKVKVTKGGDRNGIHDSGGDLVLVICPYACNTYFIFYYFIYRGEKITVDYSDAYHIYCLFSRNVTYWYYDVLSHE